jgi:hypothetical protein
MRGPWRLKLPLHPFTPNKFLHCWIIEQFLRGFSQLPLGSDEVGAIVCVEDAGLAIEAYEPSEDQQEVV